LFPVYFIIVTGWWFWQAITCYPDSWWNPIEIFSAGTILGQWTIIIVLALITQSYFAKKIGKGEYSINIAEKDK
jgi:NSS family neurotransmitter:Na+ symporter